MQGVAKVLLFCLATQCFAATTFGADPTQGTSVNGPSGQAFGISATTIVVKPDLGPVESLRAKKRKQAFEKLRLTLNKQSTAKIGALIDLLTIHTDPAGNDRFLGRAKAFRWIFTGGFLTSLVIAAGLQDGPPDLKFIVASIIATNLAYVIPSLTMAAHTRLENIRKGRSQDVVEEISKILFEIHQKDMSSNETDFIQDPQNYQKLKNFLIANGSHLPMHVIYQFISLLHLEDKRELARTLIGEPHARMNQPLIESMTNAFGQGLERAYANTSLKQSAIDESKDRFRDAFKKVNQDFITASIEATRLEEMAEIARANPNDKSLLGAIEQIADSQSLLAPRANELASAIRIQKELSVVPEKELFEQTSVTEDSDQNQHVHASCKKDLGNTQD